MADLPGPRDLHHRLIEKAVQIGGFACGAAELDQNAHMATDFLQFRRLFTDSGIVHPGSMHAARNGAKAAGFNQKKR
jgi:hypothetical protein